MIKQIYDGEFYPFSNLLKHTINERFGDSLQKIESFFTNHEVYAKNFSTYVRQTDYFNALKNKYYFIIELDNYTLLDFYGDYEPSTNKISNLCLRATLPHHHSWNSDHFREISFTDEERNEFLCEQKNFVESLTALGVNLIISIESFNPDTDSLPEAVVEFYQNGVEIETFISSDDFIKFLELYYAYTHHMTEKFKEKIKVKN